MSRGGRNGLPPSPRRLPIIGNLHQLGGTPLLALHTLSEKYGPLMLLHFGSVPTLVVSSAELAMEILKTQEAVLKKRPSSKAASSIFGKDIAFGEYDDHWRQARKIIVMGLLSARRVQSFQFIREEEVAEMVEKLRNVCRDGSSVDFGKMMTSTSKNIVARSVLGKKYDGSDDNKMNLGETLKVALDFLASFWFEDFIPYLGWIDTLTGKNARLKEASQKLHKFLDHVIDDHQIPKSDEQLTDKKDFVDIFLHLQNSNLLDIEITRDHLRGILLDMIVGGTDNGAALMEWTMAEFMKNPALMKKAQDEVRKVVGGKSKVEEDDVNKMNYLKCVIKEALRLHGSFVLTRESSTSFTLGGYNFAPKTAVYILLWAIQRDPKLWDRSEEFIPERFCSEQLDFKGQDFRFFPLFGSGRRGCPGITCAVVEVEYVIANLLYWFDWNLPDGITVENLDMEESYIPVNCKKIPLSLVPVLHTH